MTTFRERKMHNYRREAGTGYVLVVFLSRVRSGKLEVFIPNGSYNRALVYILPQGGAPIPAAHDRVRVAFGRRVGGEPDVITGKLNDEPALNGVFVAVAFWPNEQEQSRLAHHGSWRPASTVDSRQGAGRVLAAIRSRLVR